MSAGAPTLASPADCDRFLGLYAEALDLGAGNLAGFSNTQLNQ